MKTKRKWTFTRFLYHISKLGYWAVILSAIYQLFLFVHVSIGGADGAFTFNASIVPAETLARSPENTDSSYVSMLLPVVEGNVSVVLKQNTSAPLMMYLISIKAFEYIIPFLFFYLLHLLLKNVVNKDPFNEKNARYLFTIGWVLIGAEVIALLLALPQISLTNSLSLPDSMRYLILSPTGIGSTLLGVTAIVFGHIFKEATRMHEEQKLTV